LTADGWRSLSTANDRASESVEEALAQLREAERGRDEAGAKMNELLAELHSGYA
jgi:hypothetical protein